MPARVSRPRKAGVGTPASSLPSSEDIGPEPLDWEPLLAAVDRRLAEAIGQIVQESTEPLRAVFLTRTMSALAALVEELDPRALSAAAGAASDYGALIAGLDARGAVATTRDDDPLVNARRRGLEMRERLLSAEGGGLTVGDVAQHLGLTRQAVDKRRRGGRLLALPKAGGGYIYPGWQFTVQGVLAGFQDALAALSVRDPWMQAAFFLSGDARLDGGTPLEALRAGQIRSVVRAARGYGEHSAA